MEKIITRLRNLNADCYDLAKKMEKELVSLVNLCGGEINCEDREDCDTIYGIAFDEGFEQYREIEILKVFVENGHLCFRGKFLAPPSLVLEESEPEKFYIFDGMTMAVPTLLLIAECLPEYLVVK